MERDKRNYKELEENGWQYLVVWGCELKKKNLEELVDRIKGFLY